jgi:hypothetical protein
MNLLNLPIKALAALTGVALVALLATSLAANAESSEGPIELLAIDTDPTGNTATSVGDVEVCSRLEVGDQYEVDVIVKGVPESTGSAGALTGIDFTISYDERYVEVVDVQADDQFLNAESGSNLIDFTEEVPDTDGLFHVALADFGDNADESGDGILARITLEGIGVGTSQLNFERELVFLDSDLGHVSDQGKYEFDMIQNGLVTVGVDCAPNVTPAPVMTQTPAPIPTGSGSAETPGESTPVPTNSDGSTVTPGPTSTGDDAGPTGTGDTINPQDDDDDGDTIVIVAIVVTGVLLALAAAGFIALRRRGGTEI